MATTNYTLTGTGYRIQSELGDYYNGGGFAIVQWTAPYEPRYRPLSEWTSTNLTMVNWVGTYTLGDVPTLTTSSFQVSDPGALYIYFDFGSQTGGTASYNYGQAWLGQITDILTLPGGDVNIDLNTANIRPMMGTMIADASGVTFRTQDFNSWTPTAIPEPSSYGIVMGVLLLAVAVFRRKKAVSTPAQA
jgi:hypothetical protein